MGVLTNSKTNMSQGQEDNENQNYADPEEGEILSDCEYIQSSDEELNVRQRIEELEATNEELARIDCISRGYGRNVPVYLNDTSNKNCNWEKQILSDVSSISSGEFVVPKRRKREKRTHDDEYKEHCRHRLRHRCGHRRKRKQSTRHAKGRNIRELRKLRTISYSRFSGGEHCNNQIDISDESDVERVSENESLDREKLRFALARSPSKKFTKSSLMERLRNERSQTKIKDSSTHVQESNVEVIENDDHSVDLQEEHELRVLALKSAVMKKHLARKKRDAEQAYSPTDFDNMLVNTNNLVDSMQFDDDEDIYGLQASGMEISPVASPKLLDVEDNVDEISYSAVDTKPVDMDIASSDSDIEIINDKCEIIDLRTPRSESVANTNANAAIIAYETYMQALNCEQAPPPPPPLLADAMDESPPPAPPFRISNSNTCNNYGTNAGVAAALNGYQIPFRNDYGDIDLRTRDYINVVENINVRDIPKSTTPINNVLAERTAENLPIESNPESDEEEKALRALLLAKFQSPLNSKRKKSAVGKLERPASMPKQNTNDEKCVSSKKKTRTEEILKDAVRRFENKPCVGTSFAIGAIKNESNKQNTANEIDDVPDPKSEMSNGSFEKDHLLAALCLIGNNENIKNALSIKRTNNAENSNDSENAAKRMHMGVTATDTLVRENKKGLRVVVSQNPSAFTQKRTVHDLSNTANNVIIPLARKRTVLNSTRTVVMNSKSIEVSSTGIVVSSTETEVDSTGIEENSLTADINSLTAEMKSLIPALSENEMSKENDCRTSIVSDSIEKQLTAAVEGQLHKPAAVALKAQLTSSTTTLEQQVPLIPVKKAAAVIPCQKIVKRNKVINNNSKPKLLESNTLFNTELKKVPVTIVTTVAKSTKSLTTNNSRLIKAIDLPPIQVKKLIIPLRPSDSEDDIPCYTNEISDCHLSRITEANTTCLDDTEYCDNASPISLRMDSPHDSKMYDNSTKSVTSDLFKTKLDNFLRNAREQEVQKITAENVADSNDLGHSNENVANKLITPVDVGHLPKSAQLEYRRLVHRMNMLQKRKHPKKSTGASESNERTPDAVSTVDDKQIDSVAQKKPGTQQSFSAKTKLAKMSVLHSYESSYKKISTSLVSNLNKSLQLVEEAKKTKVSKLVHEKRLKELQKEMDEVRRKHAQDLQKMSKIYPAICGSNEIISTLKRRRLKLHRYATTLGKSLIGEKYRLNTELKQEISVQMEKLATSIKFVNSIKYNNLFKLDEDKQKSQLVPSENPPKDINKQNAAHVEPIKEQSVIVQESLNSQEAMTTEEASNSPCDKPLVKSKKKQVQRGSTNSSEIELPQQSQKHKSGSLKDYVSPLLFAINSVNTSTHLDPNGILCPYELMGQCEDDECVYMHLNKENAAVVSNEIIHNQVT